jgi:hypothetical protein
MSQDDSRVKRPRRTQKQTWGPYLKSLPEGKQPCGVIITNCHKIKAAEDPDYPYSAVPSEGWLRRALQGENVTVDRPLIELLGKAYKCTPREHLTLLFEAGQSIVVDSDGNIDPARQALSKALTDLMSSSEVKKAVRHFLRKKREQSQTEEEMYIDLLQVAIQARQEELQRQRLSGSEPALIVT